MRLSTHVEVEGKVLDVTPEHDAHRKQLVQDLNAQGFRVVAMAYKVMPGNNGEPHYELQDESDMTLLGYLAFLDPPKDTAAEALKRLKALNVDVKILTGDNEIITAYICKQVGMTVNNPARSTDRNNERNRTGRGRRCYQHLRQASPCPKREDRSRLAEQRPCRRFHG